MLNNLFSDVPRTRSAAPVLHHGRVMGLIVPNASQSPAVRALRAWEGPAVGVFGGHSLGAPDGWVTAPYSDDLESQVRRFLSDGYKVYLEREWLDNDTHFLEALVREYREHLAVMVDDLGLGAVPFSVLKLVQAVRQDGAAAALFGRTLPGLGGSVVLEECDSLYLHHDALGRHHSGFKEALRGGLPGLVGAGSHVLVGHERGSPVWWKRNWQIEFWEELQSVWAWD